MGLRLAFFCRLVRVRGITMTSGFSFGFEPVRVPGLLDAYRKRIKKVPPENLPQARFIFFFQKHREFGEEQAFQNVV